MNSILAAIRKYAPLDRPCTCDAYAFPHRRGSGECWADRICQHDYDLREGRCPVCDSLERADEIHDTRGAQMSDWTNKTVDLASEAMDLHDRLHQAYLDEFNKRDGRDHKVGDPRRIDRLLYLVRKAADRWRKIMGYGPMYGPGGRR